MIGTTLQGYQILSLLGRGGMGQVYLARHQRLEKLFALKVLDASLARDEEFVARFVREARRQIELKHPNVVGLHTLLEHEGLLALVLEYVDGPSLANVLKANGALRVSEALSATARSAARAFLQTL